ncbi:hypothetical protein CYMTET_23130 [Cymbomonas tetramitiformis]|uniref:cGMP-dependent protein kinase n=1 Tax=Cymbomonas tetramitiformis TaxID=36881 RepID=A0AAE0FYV4_9CHLO|nr:hypothetical protein CYMTET_23130 [Cymbomonas tetramitiformis]
MGALQDRVHTAVAAVLLRHLGIAVSARSAYPAESTRPPSEPAGAARGEVIVAAGAPVTCLSIVCEGTVKLSMDNSWSNTFQQEINLAPSKKSFVDFIVEQYEFFGERELQHPQCRSVATATAVGAVKLMQIDKREFDVCLPLLTLVLDDHLKINALTRCAFLKDLTTIQKENVVDKFCLNTFSKGDFLCREGEMGYTFFILKAGKVTIFKESEQQCSVMHVAHPYESFGELALMNNSERTASCVATTDRVECLTLMRQHFEKLLGPLRAVLARNAHEKVLKKCKQLQALPEEDLKVLARQFEEEEYLGGDAIITEGEVGHKFFVVMKGEVVITKTLPDGTKKELLRLKQGSEFGERALLYDEPRAASVIATEDTTCIYITRKVFEKHLGPLKDFMERHVQEFEKREVELALRFKDLRFGCILGTGMYGHVRQAVHKYTQEVYALKAVPKANIVEAQQQQHVQNERIVCELADHWSCCRMKRCFQNEQKVFFLLEFVQGGELFRLLSKKRRFALPMAVFYAANVVLALEHLHSKGIVYRDMKPENLMIDRTGYIKLVDFGLAKRILNSRTFTVCGTPDYQAPETILLQGHDKGVDHWGLGIFIYEMLVGHAPFKIKAGQNQRDLFKKILSGKYDVPNFMTDSTKHLVGALLQPNPKKRLGRGGMNEIKNHSFFIDIDWEEMQRRKIEPPFVPEIKDGFDLSNFDDYGDFTPAHQRKSRASTYMDEPSLWAGFDMIEADGDIDF